SSQLSLTHTAAFRPPRWRRAALGAGLVLAGGLVATLWSALMAKPGVAEKSADPTPAPPAFSTAAPRPPSAAPAAPSAAPGDGAPSQQVLGLAPAGPGQAAPTPR